MSQFERPSIHVPPNERKHAGSKGVDAGSQNAPSAGAPIGYSEGGVLLADLHANGRRCFGGWIFRSTNHSGYPIICHAVLTSSIKNEITKMSNWYRWTNANCAGLFPIYEGSVNIDKYTFFKFAVGEGSRSMRQVMTDPERAGTCKNLFTNLVMLLHHYSQISGAILECYAPLCSICLDTVYMDKRGQLTVLPLLCINNEFPRGFPLEVGTEEVDDTTDLYTAALLTYQVLSGCEYEKRSENKSMHDLKYPENVMLCIESSMNLFASKRLALSEVYAQLTREKPTADAPKTAPKKRYHPKDHYGNPIREDEDPKSDFGTSVLSALRRTLASVASKFNIESDIETSRTAGRPQPERKSTPKNWYSTPQDDIGDSYDGYGDDNGYGETGTYDDTDDYDSIDPDVNS